MSKVVLVNGEPSRCVDVSDRGFQYGDGVFTTILVQNGLPLLLDRHLMRLARDCRKLKIPFPASEILMQEVETLCQADPNGVLKIQLTRGVGSRGYRIPPRSATTRVLSINPLPDYPETLRRQGVPIRVCQIRLGINPALAGVKHMNRLEQILARSEWDDEECREGLLLDTEGYVTEGTMSNLLIVKDGILLTPKLDRCGVAGIMRDVVMERASDRGILVKEARLSLSNLGEADEIFLTNCVIGIWPVCRCDDRRYSVGPLALAMIHELETLDCLI
jgi:4-amino-4-deoxychorismate lyase